MVASQATKQVMWLPSLFGDNGIPQMKPIIIYDNNQSYISLSKDLVFHVRTKHIQIHHHLVRKKYFEVLLNWCIVI
jgi:hypothetical protein